MGWLDRLFGLDSQKMGLKDKDEKPVLLPFFPSPPPTALPPAKAAQLPPSTPETPDAKEQKHPSPGVPEHMPLELGHNASETYVDQLLARGRELVLRVVPLEEGDCLSCKLVGTGVCWGAALFVLWSYRKSKLKYQGFKRKLFAGQTASLILGLSLLGTARFLDLSIFEKPKNPDEHRTFTDLIKQDIDNFKSLLPKLSNSSSSSTSLANSDKDSSSENKQDT